MHIFRDCLATHVAIHDPEHMGIATALLGHRQFGHHRAALQSGTHREAGILCRTRSWSCAASREGRRGEADACRHLRPLLLRQAARGLDRGPGAALPRAGGSGRAGRWSSSMPTTRSPAPGAAAGLSGAAGGLRAGRFDLVLAEVLDRLEPRPGAHRRPVQAAGVLRRRARHPRGRRGRRAACRPQGHDGRALPEGPGAEDAARPARPGRGRAAPAAAAPTAIASCPSRSAGRPARARPAPDRAGRSRHRPAHLSSSSPPAAAPKAIAQRLNAEGVPGPSGRAWGPTHDPGNAARGTGILNNELYIGRLVWNRLRYVKDPSTGKRVAAAQPARRTGSSHDVPELRIIDEALWQRGQGAAAGADQLARLRRRQASRSGTGAGRASALRPAALRRLRRRLLEDLRETHFGCSTARNKGDLREPADHPPRRARSAPCSTPCSTA